MTSRNRFRFFYWNGLLLLVGSGNGCGELLGFDGYRFGDNCKNPCDDQVAGQAGADGRLSESMGGRNGSTRASGGSRFQGGAPTAEIGGSRPESGGSGPAGGVSSSFGGLVVGGAVEAGGSTELGGDPAVGGDFNPVGEAGMVRIGGGSYWQSDLLSDSGLRRIVTVQPYYLDLTEVTVEAYFSCVQEEQCNSPSSEPGCHNALTEQNAQHPINCIPWIDANRYCRSKHKRLPTEEEWEFAVHRGTSRTKPWGDAAGDASFANFAGAERNPDLQAWGADMFPGTAPVGSFPNGSTPEDGINDLFANVWEYTSSFACEVTDAACTSCPSDQQCADRCDACPTTWRIHRGLSWFDAPVLDRAFGHRGYGPTNDYAYYLGFRCAKTARE